MGKQNRTKNNTKPSNSQRSAELLAESGLSFSSFSNLGDGGLLSCLKNVDMNHIDPTFQLQLRKMTKKDGTTKYKALQEFAVLCQVGEIYNVESCLPFWPRIYCSLAIDVENRVREAVQTAHAAFVKRLGKKIATHLKQLAGTWFVSQYDTYATASSAAQNSFNDTFPANKFLNAIVFCQEEILTYIWKNIILETSQSLSSNSSVKRVLTPEEMEGKYNRLLISSLKAYRAYLKIVSVEEINNMADVHRKIINDGKFWKLSKDKDISIRTAFYNLLTSIIEYANCLLKDEKKKIISVIMNSIDESEPLLTIAIWEGVIMAINVIEDWHNFINVEKTVLSKVYFIVKNGGQNCASIIYPNLLPLLSHLIKLEIDKKLLYTRLFENMREGMQGKKGIISRSDMQTIIITYFECFRYIIHNNNADKEICTNLMIEQLIPTIKKAMTDSMTNQSLYSSELSNLIHYWSKNREISPSNCYSELIVSFWKELEILYKDMQQSSNYSLCLTNFSDLLVSLRNPTVKARKNRKVTFSDSTESKNEESNITVVPVKTDKTFVKEVEEFILLFCNSYFEEAIRYQNKINYENLIKLASIFESKQFFDKLAHAHNKDGNLFEFFETNLKTWMLDNKDDAKCVIPLIFSMLNYIDEEHQNEILMSLLEFKNKPILFHAVQCALRNKKRNNNIIKEWCHNPEITQLFLETAEVLVSDKSNEKCMQSSTLLRMAFTSSNNGDLFISEEGINSVANIICSALVNVCKSPMEYITSNTDTTSETINDLDEETSQLRDTDLILSDLIKFATELLQLSLQHNKIFSGSIEMLKTILLLNTTNEIVEHFDIECQSWKNALANIIPKISDVQFNNLVESFASVFWEKIFESNSIKIKDSFIKVASMFLEVIYENEETEKCIDLVLLFLTAINTKKWMENVYKIILSAEIMNGKLYMPQLDIEVKIWNENHLIHILNDSVDDCMDKCLKWAVVSMKILNTLNDSLAVEDQPVSIDIPNVTESVIDIIKLGRKYKNYYVSNKLFNSISLLLNMLKTEFDVIRPSKKLYTEDISDELNKIETSTIPDSDDVNTLISIRGMDSAEEQHSHFNRVMDNIVQKHSLEPSILVQECNIHSVSWENMTLPLEFIRTITYYINKYPQSVTTFQWDFILISLASWQITVNQSKNHYYDFKVKTFTIAVCQLYYAVQTIMLKHEKQPFEEFPPELLDEWKNVFMDNIHAGIAKTWILYSDLYNEKTISIVTNILLDNLGKSVQILDKSIFFKQTPEISVSCAELIKISLKLLQSRVLSLQLSAHHALNHVIEELVKADRANIEKENFDTKSLNIYKFENILIDTCRIVDTMLSDVKYCDSINSLIEPYSDMYTSTVGYLFAWTAILNMCAKADGDLRYQYAEILKNDHFTSLMNNLFKLMPSEIYHDNKVKYSKLTMIFSSVPTLNFGENWDSFKLDHLVCWVFVNCLRYLPVLVRQWWSTIDNRVSAIVDRTTTTYISPILCLEELNNKELLNIENIQTKIHLSTREVIAIYEMDDTKLELSIALPINYPLGRVTVAQGQNFVGSTKWNNCHMQLSLFLTHQNGSIWDGLMLWKKNLDKKFTGIEECYICFSILHFNTYQIPKLSCRTCRKKFHTPCLYKWFNTSQKSTCPICRNVF